MSVIIIFIIMHHSLNLLAGMTYKHFQGIPREYKHVCIPYSRHVTQENDQGEPGEEHKTSIIHPYHTLPSDVSLAESLCSDDAQAYPGGTRMSAYHTGYSRHNVTHENGQGVRGE